MDTLIGILETRPSKWFLLEIDFPSNKKYNNAYKVAYFLVRIGFVDENSKIDRECPVAISPTAHPPDGGLLSVHPTHAGFAVDDQAREQAGGIRQSGQWEGQR
jgi:hypothetical protein